MLVKSMAGQNIVLSGGLLTGYQVVKANGAVITGGGALTLVATGFYSLAIASTDIDQVGPVTFLPFTVGPVVVGSRPDTVVQSLPFAACPVVQ